MLCEEASLSPIQPSDLGSSPDIGPAEREPADTLPSPAHANESPSAAKGQAFPDKHAKVSARPVAPDQEVARYDADFFRMCRLPLPEAADAVVTAGDNLSPSVSPVHSLARLASD
jgi:hypothetical protein